MAEAMQNGRGYEEEGIGGATAEEAGRNRASVMFTVPRPSTLRFTAASVRRLRRRRARASSSDVGASSCARRGGRGEGGEAT